MQWEKSSAFSYPDSVVLARTNEMCPTLDLVEHELKPSKGSLSYLLTS